MNFGILQKIGVNFGASAADEGNKMQGHRYTLFFPIVTVFIPFMQLLISCSLDLRKTVWSKFYT